MIRRLDYVLGCWQLDCGVSSSKTDGRLHNGVPLLTLKFRFGGCKQYTAHRFENERINRRERNQVNSVSQLLPVSLLQHRRRTSHHRRGQHSWSWQMSSMSRLFVGNKAFRSKGWTSEVSITLIHVGTYLIRTRFFLMHVGQGNVRHARQFWIIWRLLVQSAPAECRSL